MLNYIQVAGGSNKGKVYKQHSRVKCDICGKADLVEYIDGATTNGPWANMCRDCHKEHGVGMGTGRGQTYCLADKAITER